jgi:predicted acetyltransferase
VHRASSGQVDGYVTYRVTEKSGETALEVVDLVTSADEAYLALWELLLSVDLVTSITRAAAPLDDPLVHAVDDARTIRVTEEQDHVWLRLLDLPAAFSARPWAADGIVTVTVTDDLGHAAGSWRLSSEGGAGTAERVADGPADLELDAAALGTLWLGGVDPVTLTAAGLVREHRAGAVQELRVMLRPERPLYGVTSF